VSNYVNDAVEAAKCVAGFVAIAYLVLALMVIELSLGLLVSLMPENASENYRGVDWASFLPERFEVVKK
jgi:hypothetical protein